MSICPHANIVHCPLYVAAHGEQAALGCDDGELGEGDCAVARGLNYHEALGRLIAADPILVAQLKWKEDGEALRKRRANKSISFGCSWTPRGGA